MVANTAFGLRVMRGVYDPQKLFMTDLALQGRQFVLQLLAERSERIQKGLAIGLDLLADLFPIGRGGGILKLSEQRRLLREVLITSLVKGLNQRLNFLGDRSRPETISVRGRHGNRGGSRGVSRGISAGLRSCVGGRTHPRHANRCQNPVTNCFHYRLGRERS